MLNGKCGNNLNWILEDNGVLTISGTGEMDNYKLTYVTYAGEEQARLEDTTPWKDSKERIKGVSIAPGVTSIGDAAFAGCPNLENAEIPDSVVSIGFIAFACCKSLKEVKIPKGVSFIKGLAFASTLWQEEQDDFLIVNNILISYTGGDTEVNIPAGVTEIGECAFWNCDWVKKVSIPEGVSVINSLAFYNCNLHSFNIPNGVVAIGESAFDDHCELSICIPRSLKYIGYYAFGNFSGDVFYEGSEEEWREITRDGYGYGFGEEFYFNQEFYFKKNAGMDEEPELPTPKNVRDLPTWQIDIEGALKELYRRIYGDAE